ncbi:MAG TPA: two-component system response regulator [Rhodospirillaceae bacterium]|nr:two-component system response regulator [Alphaproteobacteria bacterium]OUT39661.1 MAG: two-component system response regulator [Micavibrio sp. TMED2]HCI47383.1 two-component system response regulator [Rhodospirillaceae bacterium]MAS49056.1 two-component system response regulator [Alphaproteobacteria bacterium]MAX97342.1 two-component system response regulator [Alphaproteobacteria bacterium]|tara:strand:- start:7915 stop:8280 length:366 start_codon:yes stop_codon:yes gene_type:complete
MKTCLVVDDSRIVRRVARKILEELGFGCVEAADGEEALAACREEMPAVILLDWNMPVMTGIEFLRQLSDFAGSKMPKVVFCTTESDMENIHEALAAGASEYMFKPFDSEILQGKFRQIGVI